MQDKQPKKYILSKDPQVKYYEWSQFQKFENRRVFICIKTSLALIAQESQLASVCTFSYCESRDNATYCFTGDTVQINWLMFLKALLKC